MASLAPQSPPIVPAVISPQEVIVSRVTGGFILAVIAIFALTAGNRLATPIVILSFPLAIGALLSLISSNKLTQMTESWETVFQVKLEAARSAAGAFARWFKRPLYGGFVLLWNTTRRIGYSPIRASLRVTGLLYFGAAMLYLLVMAMYLIVALAVLALILWIVSKVAGWNDVATPKAARFFGGSGRSVRREGLTGPFTERYDKHGQKTGESRVREGFLGQYTEHADTTGTKVGESHEGEGLLGPYVEHTDKDGKKVGESREREGLLGPYVEHTDKDRKKVGESREREGLMGPYVEHSDD